jgi:hypothetical protein
MNQRLRMLRASVDFAICLAGASLLTVGVVASARAGDHVAFAARTGVDVTAAAAHAWSSDAVLVYVENDESLDTSGSATRWGYLYYSPLLEQSRAYSVRDGAIKVAENLAMKFEAPPVGSNWIDSGAALAIAERKGGLEFRTEHGGTLTTMLLMRGVFQKDDPDQTTWTLIYTAPDAPSLFVVIDAAEGKVRHTWRG